MGEGIPLPSRLGGLGNVMSSPSKVREELQTDFGEFLVVKVRPLTKICTIVLCGIESSV